jgi:transcriptional regulator with XRE-family HTH domain
MKPKRPMPSHLALLDLATAFGEIIKSERVRRGLSQAQVAKQLGIARGNYTRSERGNHTPSLETLVRIADIYGIAPSRLLDQIIRRAAQRASSGEPVELKSS